MNAYSYNEHMEYIGPVACQKDPVRSEKEKRDVWLLPANSAFTAPPDFDHETQKAVWNGEAWHVEALPQPEPVVPPIPAQLREEAYNTQSIIEWHGEMLTVTQAAQLWQYYAAEGNTEKTDELTALIATAKADIRCQYPDEETES